MLQKSATLLRESAQLIAPTNAALAMQHNGDAELLETQVSDCPRAYGDYYFLLV